MLLSNGGLIEIHVWGWLLDSDNTHAWGCMGLIWLHWSMPSLWACVSHKLINTCWFRISGEIPWHLAFQLTIWNQCSIYFEVTVLSSWCILGTALKAMIPCWLTIHDPVSVSLWLIKASINFITHDDVIKWKHFPRYWPFVQGIHRSPVNSLHKVQWHRALLFSLICTRINGWVNNGEAGDLRRHCAH